jgi:hypothetical protein
MGSNLLKHTSKFPHIRLFQLSNDLKRILWYTKSKSIDEAQVSIESIIDISIGQVTENFIKYPLKMLEDCSFSVFYKKKNGGTYTLDLTCKDNREFDLWVIGIKALHSHFNKKIISKDELLSHSKSYQEQVKKGNIGNCSRFLIYTNEQLPKAENNKKLENFIISRKLSQADMATLINRECNRVKELRGDVETLTLSDEYKTGHKENGYEMIFAEEAIVDDLDTQKNLMLELFKECEQNLSILAQEFLFYIKEHNKDIVHEEDMDNFMKNIYNIGLQLETHMPKSDTEINPEKIKNEFFLNELDIKLWKIEIDLENVGDIINRFKNAGNEGFVDKLKKNLINFFK